MLRELTSRDIAEWIAYYSCEPWGQRHVSEQIGFIAARILNMFRDKGSKPFKESDFWLPSRLDDPPEQQEQADDAKAMGIFSALKEGLKKDG